VQGGFTRQDAKVPNCPGTEARAGLVVASYLVRAGGRRDACATARRSQSESNPVKPVPVKALNINVRFSGNWRCEGLTAPQSAC